MPLNLLLIIIIYNIAHFKLKNADFSLGSGATCRRKMSVADLDGRPSPPPLGRRTDAVTHGTPDM